MGGTGGASEGGTAGAYKGDWLRRRAVAPG